MATAEAERQRGRRGWRAAEGPTWLLAGTVYGGWFLLTWHHAALPLPLLLVLGAWFIAWHGSLQHEVIHGHPAGGRLARALISYPPLALWLPYPIYCLTHRQHHTDTRLTDPFDDPESFYQARARWRQWPRSLRRLIIANHTLAGRLLIGPLFVLAVFFSREIQRLWQRKRPSHLPFWAAHVPAASVVIFWVVGVCGVPLWQYLAIVYLGTSVLLLRSFYEHRAAERPEARTAIVEATFPFGVLFLFNNLHAAHHARPELPWYKLPTFYRAHRTTILAANRGFYFRSYGEIVCRYWRRPNYFPVHPDTRRRNRTHAAA